MHKATWIRTFIVMLVKKKLKIIKQLSTGRWLAWELEGHVV